MGGRWIAFLLVGVSTASSFAQDRFELLVPGTPQVSKVERTAEQLRIEDSEGNVTVYQRTVRHDSADGQFEAYASGVARQVIRWPIDDQGRLQIATDNGGTLAFRPSQMEIRGATSPVPAVAMDEIDTRTAFRFLAAASGPALALDRNDRVALRPSGDELDQSWHLTPLGTGLFRIHSDRRGARWSLAGRTDNSVHLARTANLPEQLWRLMTVPGRPSELLMLNLGMGGPPRVLGRDRGGRLLLRPRDGSSWERWHLMRVGPSWPSVFDEYRFRSREARPNPPLEAARVELRNSHGKEIWVLLTDRLSTSPGKRLRIPAGKSETVELARESGATLVEVFERATPFGVERDEWSTPIPPPVRYDLSVYEVIVQSVAIDATVPGGKLEDVQYAPRSVGWLELPPGPLLSDGALDVYSSAKELGNPGQVRRIDPRDWRATPAPRDPVEEALEKVQKKK